MSGTAPFAAVKALPILTFVSSSATTGSGGTTFTTTTADIGNPAYIGTRRVLIMISGGQLGRTLSSCTVNGVSCDASSIADMNCGSSNDMVHTASALVPSGTTGVTITLVFSNTVFVNPRIGIYNVDNSLLNSFVPVTHCDTAAGATSLSGAVATLAGGVIASAIYTTNNANAPSITSSDAGLIVDFASAAVASAFGHANGTPASAASNTTWGWLGSSSATMGSVALR